MKRNLVARCVFALFALSCLDAGVAAGAADPAKVLRIASPAIDTLDPQQYTDDPSFRVLMTIFESLYEWDYLASPPKLTPLTASGPIEITSDGKTWTAHVRPGILFTDDPAFKGKPRELTADDYVYSYKRWIDPSGRRRGSPIVTDLIVGARLTPDSKAPKLTLSQRTGAVSREVETLWKKNMDAIGLSMGFAVAPFQDMVKALESGKYQLYYGASGGSPSGHRPVAVAELGRRTPCAAAAAMRTGCGSLIPTCPRRVAGAATSDRRRRRRCRCR